MQEKNSKPGEIFCQCKRKKLSIYMREIVTLNIVEDTFLSTFDVVCALFRINHSHG